MAVDQNARRRQGIGPIAKLTYSAIASLDGYVADREGNFEWAAPEEELHGFINELERGVGTYLYGRRMYETMVFWETVETGPERPEVGRDFARIWRAAEKVVYSRTLDSATSARTRIEPEFDPAAVRAMKAAAQGEISVGGAELAGQALAAGLVDECHLFVVPVVIGAGTRWLPDGLGFSLDLLSARRFPRGVVHLHYALRA